mmetsp:Transcript_35063/g.99748  ORF Transcript_35063/g.99748 Transcript_35063/m.99748 type:complete len:216 (+) Transcript_35063:109-756(+)
MCIARLIESQARMFQAAADQGAGPFGEAPTTEQRGAPPVETLPRKAARQDEQDRAGSEASRAAKDNHVLDKTRLCRFYSRGKCTQGQACAFAHGRRELRPQPNLFRTQVCLDFSKTGACSFGASCRFAHSLVELRLPDVAAAPRSPASSSSSGALSPAESLARELALVQQQARRLQAEIDALAGDGASEASSSAASSRGHDAGPVLSDMAKRRGA